MAHWCESCGQTLPEGETAMDATWLGAPADHQHSFSGPKDAKKSGRDKKLLMVVAGALAVWGLFVGLGRIVTPDDGIDEQAAAEIEEARLDREAEETEEAEASERAEAEAQAQAVAEAEAAAEAAMEAERSASAETAEIGDVEGDYGAADAAPGFPTDASSLGARAAVSVQVERLQRQLARRDSSAFIAYRADSGIVVVDLVSGQSAVSDLAPGVATVLPGAHLLRSGHSTFAVDPVTLRASRVAENSSIVVNDTLDGNTYLVDSGALSGQGAIIEVVVDGDYGFYRLPPGGLQIQPVDGLGVLAVPKSPTGETLIAQADSFTTLSPNRVLTGSSAALLEQVCASEDQCSLAITGRDDGVQNLVPTSFVRFGDQYSLSPNGQALLRHSPEGFAEVYVAGTETILWVIGAGMRSPAWGPNSDFIAWIDRIGDPKLKIMFPDERDWLTIDLRDLGAPPPASPELIVFTADPTSQSNADN